MYCTPILEVYLERSASQFAIVPSPSRSRGRNLQHSAPRSVHITSAVSSVETRYYMLSASGSATAFEIHVGVLLTSSRRGGGLSSSARFLGRATCTFHLLLDSLLELLSQLAELTLLLRTRARLRQ